MKTLLKPLLAHKKLTRKEAYLVMKDIGMGKYSEAEMTAFTTVFLMRSISIEELLGFREALLEMALPLSLSAEGLIDIVGTGGDEKNTFNISTLSCFIVAGAGHKVAKHGNYGSSSISGASNLMEALGYNFSADSTILNKQLEDANICFLHAPLFHPALKNVAGMRKSIGLRTFFNMLGPLVNPARPQYQLIGVYNLEMARIYTYALQQLQTDFCIVHSFDGYDEISLTSDAKIITAAGEKVHSAMQLGKRNVKPEDIFGGKSVGGASKIFLAILGGKGSWPQNAVVLANAALALELTGQYENYEAAYQAAVQSLESGAAEKCLQKIMS